jgi:hypothetical protein
MSHLQTHEMGNRKSDLCIRLWLQPMVTRGEGASAEKFCIEASEIAT